MPRRLGERFFARDADRVARDLVGRLIVHGSAEGRCALRITEAEAYFGPPGSNARFSRRRDVPAWLARRVWVDGDPASHAHRGRTARNAPMYGSAGRAYVYLIYGMHACMNVVTGVDGDPQAVLLRAGIPVEGVDEMLRRRGVRSPRDVAPGPGRLAGALGLSTAWSGVSVLDGPLGFEAAPRARIIEATPRVNVVGAEDLPLRFVARDAWALPAGRRRAAG